MSLEHPLHFAAGFNAGRGSDDNLNLVVIHEESTLDTRVVMELDRVEHSVRQLTQEDVFDLSVRRPPKTQADDDLVCAVFTKAMAKGG